MELKVTEMTVFDGVGVIRLARPERGNSWTNRMNAEYRWIHQQFDEDPNVRVIVVTGAGRNFCVGADFRALDHHQSSDKDYVKSSAHEEMERPGQGVRPEFDEELVWQWGLRKPVIAAVNGACAGIAVALAAFCDLRYAAAGVKFTTSTPKLGLPTEYGLSWILPRIMGLTNAAGILMTGRVFLAEEAKDMQFLNGVLPRETFFDDVMDIARDMAAQTSPISMRSAKRQLYADILHDNPGAAVAVSKDLIGGMLKHPDCAEGVAAMREKRKPEFLPLSTAGEDL